MSTFPLWRGVFPITLLMPKTSAFLTRVLLVLGPLANDASRVEPAGIGTILSSLAYDLGSSVRS